MDSPFQFPNIDSQINKYIFCPSGNCLNIPEIHYSNTPLKTEFQFNCECDINNKNMDLKEFLDKSSHVNCLICLRKITDNKINYCKNCKTIFDNSCLEYHKRLSHDILLNEYIFNFCLEHKNSYMFRCMECNKSLCINCDLNSHNDKLHTLNQISRFSLNIKSIDEIKSIIDKQKKFFEKIKNIYNNILLSLENDIEIKERIVNNYMTNKYNYNSYLNMNNLTVYNNEKYEKLLDDILLKSEQNKNAKKEIDTNDYINNYLSIFYYSLMINKEEEINNSLIKDLAKKINNLDISQNNLNNNILNLYNEQMIEEKAINNNLDNSKNISTFSIKSNSQFNNCITPLNSKFCHSNELNDINILNKCNSQMFPKNNNINNNFNNLNIPINQSFSYISNSPNNKNNYITHNSANYKESKSVEKKYDNKHSKKNKSSNKKKDKKKTPKKEKNKSNEEIEKNEEIYKNKEINKEDKKDLRTTNAIHNMIILKSGNFAVSMKEAIEIYDLRKLNFSGENSVYKNDIIKNNCLLQKINIVKGRYISYVLELSDQTLLCATYSKIFRIKLTNHDLNHTFLSFIKLGNESPTKIIILGDAYLVVLTEIKKYCNIKIFQKNNKNINEETIHCQNNNNITANEKNELINCDDVPAIGNCGLFLKNDIYEDTSFELIHNNINENKKLFVTIFPIEKKYNELNNNEIKDENNDNYSYEFIATSNYVFDYTKSRLAFYGLNKANENKFEKIKEINNLSCSIGADSICQINNKYLCVGLQSHNLNGQIDGFAFIDINKREICRIIKYNLGVSSLYYNSRKNLLLASMEIKDKNNCTFMTKLFNVIQNKGDRGNDEIELKGIYQFKNDIFYSITSILLMNVSCYKENLDEKNIKENIIVATASKDANLEVIKINV